MICVFLFYSIPDVFDTEEESAIETARNSPLARIQTRARQVDNREIDEDESQVRFTRTRQTLQGYSPDHQPRRRSSRGTFFSLFGFWDNGRDSFLILISCLIV